MNTFYVYQLIDPRNNLPFYIGKGNGKRMYHHVRLALKEKISNGNKYLFNKIKKIISLGFSIEYHKVIENVSEQEALVKEIELIKKYGMYPVGCLCNLTIGGEGVVGYKWSSEQKDRMKNSMIRIVNTEEWRKKHWDGMNKVDWKRVRKLQSATLKNKFLTDIKFLDEHRKRIKLANSSDESKKQNSIRITKFYETHPEQKEKLSKIQKHLWAIGKYNNSKTWCFVSPTGETTTFINLQKFCRKNNLSQSNMINVFRGKRKSHKGWKRQLT